MAAHATLRNALVLEPSSTVQLVVGSDHGAMSIDGQVDVPLQDGEVVEVTPSRYQARFLRARAGDAFYASLLARRRFGASKGC